MYYVSIGVLVHKSAKGEVRFHMQAGGLWDRAALAFFDPIAVFNHSEFFTGKAIDDDGTIRRVVQGQPFAHDRDA